MKARAHGLAVLCLTASATLGGVHIACKSNPCCGGGNNEISTPPPQPFLVVLDAVSGMPMCSASGVVQCNADPRPGVCTATCTDNAPSPCDQDQAGTYSMTATVTAPGYAPGQVTFPINIGACGSPPIEDGGVSATVHLAPNCSMTTTHDNGVGQTWTDCTPSRTYTLAESVAACDSFPGSSDYCFSSDCPDDAGPYGGEFAVCTQQSSPCQCWTFQGNGAGHVHVSEGGCVCASDADPAWY